VFVLVAAFPHYINHLLINFLSTNLQVSVRFCCVRFSCFSCLILRQEIGWEERFRNDLFLSGGM